MFQKSNQMNIAQSIGIISKTHIGPTIFLRLPGMLHHTRTKKVIQRVPVTHASILVRERCNEVL